MKFLRSFFVCFLLVFFFVQFGFPQDAEIARYPSRPISLIVAFPPGASGDLSCRLLAKEAERFLGQPIVVVNKPGGGGTIGVAALAAAKPDGYTIGESFAQALFILPFLENIPYQPLKDLRFILQFVELNFGLLVKADSPFKSLSDIMAYARQNPKKVTYGTNSPNSISRIIVEQIAKKEKVQLTHIPFKGGPEYQAALLGGHILFTAGDFNPALVEAGQTRILLFLGEKRSPEYPQTPVLKDLGYDIPTPLFVNIAGPRRMPDEIANRLEASLTKAIAEPAFIKGMKDAHLTVFYRNSKDITDYVAYNYKVYPKFMKEMGLIK